LSLILAAAYKSCIYRDKCKPATETVIENGKPVEKLVTININISGNPINVSIFDIISETRKLPKDKAIEYFTNVLFPFAKRSI
jgi:hypothetical protein